MLGRPTRMRLPLGIESEWLARPACRMLQWTETVPQTESSPGLETAGQEHLVPQYHVVLLDDDDHTYDYVIEMLQKLFCYSTAEAFQHAVEVDTTGRTIVITCELPQAEFARDQIHQYGPDWRMPDRSKGSMKAVLEPAPL